MGMDLIAKSNNKNDIHYNWAGWSWIQDHLTEWGVDISEFDGLNDGKLISKETCKKVAAAIEQHINELSKEDQDWLRPHIEQWRNSNGFEQW